MIRGRMRYFVQLIVEGVPPVKHVYAPKDLKVAVDPGPRTMTFYSPELLEDAISVYISVA